MSITGLVIIFIFLLVGIATIIFILYTIIFSIIKNKKAKRKDKEIKNLKNALSPYEFESTQKNAVNKSFSFMEYLHSGDYVKVIKTFKDYYGFTHQVGEKFYFACAYFLPYEDGYTLYISKDKINVSTIYLEDKEDRLYTHPEEYFEIIEQGRFKREIKF